MGKGEGVAKWKRSCDRHAHADTHRHTHTHAREEGGGTWRLQARLVHERKNGEEREGETEGELMREGARDSGVGASRARESRTARSKLARGRARRRGWGDAERSQRVQTHAKGRAAR